MAPPSKVLALGEAIMSAREAVGDSGALERIKSCCTEASAEDKHESGKYKGMHGLSIAIRAAVEPNEGGKICAAEWGYELLDTVLTHGRARVDARLEGFKTSLMLAAHMGREDLCDLLLDSNADPSAQDREGVSPVHAACMRLDEKRVATSHKVLKLLMVRGGKKVVNEPTKQGQTPLAIVVVQTMCGAGVGKVVDLLVRHGASLTLRVRPSWHSAYSLCLAAHGKDHALTQHLRSKHEGDEGAEACAEQSQAIGEYLRLCREFLHPSMEKARTDTGPAIERALEKARKAREAAPAGETGGEGPSGDGTPEDTEAQLLMLRAARVQSTAVVDAICRFAELDPKALDASSADGGASRGKGDACCGLERLWRVVMAVAPRVVTSSWETHDALPFDQAGEIQLLSGSAATTESPEPLLVVPPDEGVERLVAGRGIAEAFLRSIQAPIQHAFAFAVPNDAALAALAAHAPLCESARGAGEPSTPWDAEALAAYRGETVAHVGELTPEFGTRTTSEAFAQALMAGFELQQTVPLPNWPHMKDELTIWKRRAEALPVVL